MTVHFSSNSTVQAPRLVIALAVIVLVAGATTFAVVGTIGVVPAVAVFAMGLYFNGAKRYDVLDDRIRTSCIVGQRDVRFENVTWFEDKKPESFGARLQSFLTGAPLSSGIEVHASQSGFSRQPYLWVRDREAFLGAAREGLAAWRAARS